MKTKYKILLVVAVLLGHFSILLLRASPNPLHSVRVGIAPVVSSALVFGEKEGFFSKRGVPASFIDFKVGAEGFRMLERGELDFAQISSVVLAEEILQNKKFVILATSGESALYVITRKTSGINKTEDIKGRRVGVLAGSSSHLYALDYQLQLADLKRNDVAIVPLAQTELLRSLADGVVDAFIASEPNVSTAQSLTNDIVAVEPGFAPTIGLQIVAMKKFVEENPKAVEAFLAGVDESLAQFASRREEALEFTSAYLDIPKSLLISVVRDAFTGLTLDQSLVTSLENLCSWYGGEVRVDILDFLYFDALKQINPAAVTILH